ncbi:MAG: xanthine dehydrogenase family protein subunit M [Candidatus Promineifilaceae bacterium]
MKPAPFKYTSPPTLTAVLDLLAENAYDAKLLAGGQSLIPAMNFRLTQPAMLIDLNRLGELDYVRIRDNNAVQIGSMTRQRTLERDPLIRDMVPLMSETLPFIAHSQIRNRGTIGGSLAHADPAAELPAILVALQGRLRLRNRMGERWVPAEAFFKGIFTTDLAQDEVIVEVEIPSVSKGEGWSFLEFSRRKGDYALMGVAALLTVDHQGFCRSVRLVYLNSGEVPIIASQATASLEGEKPSDRLFEAAARVAAQDVIAPTANIHASVPYLRHLAYSLTKRALDVALSRALASVEE